MLQIARDDAVHRQLIDWGWAHLPGLDKATIEELLGKAGAADAVLRRHALSSDVGFDELWGDVDTERRNRLQNEVARILRPALDSWFSGFRAVLHNIFVKRANAPRSAVPFHRDFAVIDERAGEMALQIWIPLVDVTPGNGALIVVDGTDADAPAMRPHDSRNPFSERPVTDLPPGAHQPELQAGAGLVFTNGTIHASTPNTSASDRPAVGCIVVPEAASIAHWVARGADRMELWTMSDSDFLTLEPGSVPPGATLAEVVGPA